jgi:large repetitive protein
MALIGKVVAITGTAYLRSPNGVQRELALGDAVETGDTIVTAGGAQVDLELVTGRPMHIGANHTVTFNEELSSVFVPNSLDSTLDPATIATVIKAIEEGFIWFWFC